MNSNDQRGEQVTEGNQSQKEFWDSRCDGGADVEALAREDEIEPRFAYMRRYMPNEGKILEAGCGDGKFVFCLRKLGYEIYGLDFAERVIEKARALAVRTGAAPPEAFQVGDVTKLPFPDGDFSGYISMGVLEHFHDGGAAAIQEARRVLSPGGVVFITVPNLFSPWTPVRALASRFRPLVYQKNISRFALRRAMESAGFRTIYSANFDVPASLVSAFAAESPRVRGVPNPFYPLRRHILAASKFLERVMPLIGYHSLYVGVKTEA